VRLKYNKISNARYRKVRYECISPYIVSCFVAHVIGTYLRRTPDNNTRYVLWDVVTDSLSTLEGAPTHLFVPRLVAHDSRTYTE
jgi:hypothetical protein